MSLEQLALLGIIIFAFMAVATSFGAVRSFKRAQSRSGGRCSRRLIGGEQAALAVARSVVSEVKECHLFEAELSKEQGRLTPTIEKALLDAENYFLNRVESRHRQLFSQAIRELVLEIDAPKEDSSPYNHSV